MELSKDKKAIVSRGNKVVYDCGDRIVKVFNPAKPAADIFNEALNLARVGEAGISVPELIEVSKVDDRWAIAYKKIEGTTLEQLMEEHPYDSSKYLEQLADLQIDTFQGGEPAGIRHPSSTGRRTSSCA